MRYFRHLVHAHVDMKVLQLAREYKYAGYAVFFLALETIGKEGKDGKMDMQKLLEYVSQYFSDTPDKVKAVINRATEIGLFVCDGDMLFCPKLVNGYSSEWANRKRHAQILDTLERTGEISSALKLSQTQTEKYVDQVKQVLHYLNERTGKQYRWQSKDNQLLLTSRLKDGYTVKDLMLVIDNQCERWLGDEKMEPYLRPETLFRRSKIEGYLNNNLGLRAKMKDWGKDVA